MLRHLLIGINREAKINFSHPSGIITQLLFCCIFLSIFLIVDGGLLYTDTLELQAGRENYLLIFDYFIITSCLIASSSGFLKEDFEDGSLEQAAIGFEYFEIYIITKVIANWLFLCLPSILIIGTLQNNFMLIKAMLASFIINSICCFCGTISGLGNSSSLIATIALPLITPILILSIDNQSNHHMILLMIAIFSFTTLTFATSKVAKIIID